MIGEEILVVADLGNFCGIVLGGEDFLEANGEAERKAGRCAAETPDTAGRDDIPYCGKSESGSGGV